jgi:hypothetical protein
MTARPSETVFWKIKIKMKSWSEFQAACQKRGLAKTSRKF